MSDENKVKIKTTEEFDSTAEEQGVEDVSIQVLAPLSVTSKKPHSMEVRRQTFELFMNHVPYKKICEVTGVPMGTLLNWISRGSWGDAKRENDKEALQQALSAKTSMLNSLVLEILEGAMKTVRRDNKKDGFSTKDLPHYLSALTSLDKLSRLAQGLPTSISEERSKKARFVLPTEHLKQISSVHIKDPFGASDEAETVEPVNGPTEDS